MSKLWNAITKVITKQRRKMLANEIFARHGGVVQRGAYKGLKLDGSSDVSRGPLGIKILGLYEPPVVNEIAASAPFRDLVNFGAADGYMSLGPLYAGYCERSICFELTEGGRTAVAENATINDVRDKVVIRGKADETIMAQLNEIGVERENMLILCDIEGAEFSVLSADVLSQLRGTKIIIELHDRHMKDGLALREALISRLPDGASHRILHANGVDYGDIEELALLSDNDRALVMSEGRKFYGEWMIIEYV